MSLIRNFLFSPTCPRLIGPAMVVVAEQAALLQRNWTAVTLRTPSGSVEADVRAAWTRAI